MSGAMKICPHCGRENPADYTWCPECGAMPKYEPVEPAFPVEVPGFDFLGRGPTATGASGGWQGASDIYYRCVSCGELMCSTLRGYFSCYCKAMHCDWDAGRFGSSYGDKNVLVYRKTAT
jgi:hypothetical protein